MSDRQLKLGATPVGSSPEVFDKLIRDEIREVGADHPDGGHQAGMSYAQVAKLNPASAIAEFRRRVS